MPVILLMSEMVEYWGTCRIRGGFGRKSADFAVFSYPVNCRLLFWALFA
jgi:hypothetical protein